MLLLAATAAFDSTLYFFLPTCLTASRLSPSTQKQLVRQVQRQLIMGPQPPGSCTGNPILATSPAQPSRRRQPSRRHIVWSQLCLTKVPCVRTVFPSVGNVRCHHPSSTGMDCAGWGPRESCLIWVRPVELPHCFLRNSLACCWHTCVHAPGLARPQLLPVCTGGVEADIGGGPAATMLQGTAKATPTRHDASLLATDPRSGLLALR